MKLIKSIIINIDCGCPYTLYFWINILFGAADIEYDLVIIDAF